MGAAIPFALPLPPCDVEPAVGAALGGDGDCELPAAWAVAGGTLPATVVVGDESETLTPAPVPDPVEDALAVTDAGSCVLASEAPSATLLLPFEVVPCADFSELVLDWRAARRRPSAAAASPSDWPKLPLGARTHSKLMVYAQVV